MEGERFAAAVRKSRPAAASTAAARPPLRGAGTAKARGGSGFLRAFVSRPAVLLYGVILGAAAFAAFGQGLLQRAGVTVGPPAADGALQVGGEGGIGTIAEALAQAKAGQTIEVAPGNYREALQLKSGVALVSRVPRGAVILPPAGSSAPALTAQGILGARLEGFRILGDAQSPLQVGLRLADSQVAVEGIEITGAQTAAIDVAGADLSSIRASFLHDNPGNGVLIEQQASPRLLHNLIANNGRTPGGAPRPGIEIHDAARPELVENRFAGNAAGGVLLPSPERAEEVWAWNSFTSPRADAVRALAAPPARPPGGQGR